MRTTRASNHSTTARPLCTLARSARASVRLATGLMILLTVSYIGEGVYFCCRDETTRFCMLLSIQLQLMLIIFSDLVPSCGGEMPLLDWLVRKPHSNSLRHES